MSFCELSSQDVHYNSNGKVMVGCGCKTVMDVVSFIREKKIEYLELAWADEMGLWHNQTVPVNHELTYASLQEGVPCKDGRYLIPDPLSARIAPRSQPNTMLFTCKPPTSKAHLKTKHLNPEWIEMISKKLMENDKRPTDKHTFTSELFLDESRGMNAYGKRDSFSVPISPNAMGGYISPGSPGCMSSPGSSPSSPVRSPVGSPGMTPSDLGAGNGFIEWKLVRNDPYGSAYGTPTLILPLSPTCSEGNTPPGSVPGSPCLPASPRSPLAPEDVEIEPKGRASKKSPSSLLVPPLLRPRQIHPTKAHKLGITKPVKKRRNTEHLFCRHCGTTETPEWRRGPDGRKSYPLPSTPFLYLSLPP